ncbi:hypothetical protein L6452_39658 [Arctium lappa]|uniref:Uncharacterized protein n=1 Tax=Arctium lappa TaxID=4217 RepID=A0ACB8XTS7_ARCLA|nr:hypothetical protein L6452_39658 [Arctium lappa]
MLQIFFLTNKSLKFVFLFVYDFMLLSANVSDDKAVIPIAPDVRTPVTASPMASNAGTRTGLKMTKSGVAMVSPMTVAVSVIAEKTRRNPPIGKRVTTAMTFERVLITLAVGWWWCRWWLCRCSAIDRRWRWFRE